VRDRSKLPCLPTGRHVARIARPEGHAIQKKKNRIEERDMKKVISKNGLAN